MQFQNNITNDIVTAYQIGSVVITSEGNYSIKLPEASKIVGLYPSQTADYVPVVNDFYIDTGDIGSSQIMEQSMFLTNYTQVN